VKIIFLCTAALLAGVMNGVAGGGGLIVFPALVLVGVEPIHANATSTAALWFGTVASCIAYRRELSTQRQELFLLSSTSIVGGIFGSYLLLHTSSANFTALIPYLMLVATVLFAVNRPVMKWLKGSERRSGNIRLPIIVLMLLQLVIATYGGYFGGGAGILMLAVLNIMGIENIHKMNAFKSWLATCINAVAIAYFIFAQKIVWFEAIMMAVAAIIGGYTSADIARKLPQVLVQYFITGVGFCMTVYFFMNK
jgi:uncharacterized protein